MGKKVWLISIGIVIILLTSIIIVYRQPLSEEELVGGGTDDWLNGNSEDLSNFLVPRDQTEFDWANMTEAPSWRIGDKWTYEGRLDATSVVDDAGVEGAAINDLITGTANLRVDNISLMEFSGEESLTYSLHLWGTFSGVATFPVPLLQTYTDTLVVTYDAYEYIRVSDLSLMQKDESLRIDFEHPFGVEEIAEIQIISQYSPPLEWWDFPLGINETWLGNHEISENYSGNSDYVSLPSEDNKIQRNWRLVNIEEGVGKDLHQDCTNSRNVTAFDEENKAAAWRWFCPDVGQWSWRVGEVPLGVTGDFRLLSYEPSSTRESTPAVQVELMHQGVNKSVEVAVWVNVTYQNISMAGAQGVVYYGCCTAIPFTTDSNGSAFLMLNASNQFDPSPTYDDLASHGIIALLNETEGVGIASLTLYGSALGLVIREYGANEQWLPQEVGVNNLNIAAAAFNW